MSRKKVIRDCIIMCVLFSAVAMTNLKWNYFVIPAQDQMIDTQSNLFTICSVFAGFSFSILGLVMGIFSEKMIEKLKGTTLIQRKCTHIVQSIIYFCISGFISLLFMLGFNIFISELTGKEKLIDNVLYINGIGFLLLGMMYFIWAVKNLFGIIEKLYAFNENAYLEKEKKYQLSRKKLEEKRITQESNANSNE